MLSNTMSAHKHVVRIHIEFSVSVDSFSASRVSDSLELELSGELVLSLFQLLTARHVLVVHVLDLRFDALKLGVQLPETNREWDEEMWFNWSLVAHSNSTGGTGVWRIGQPIGVHQHGSSPSVHSSSAAALWPQVNSDFCPDPDLNITVASAQTSLKLLLTPMMAFIFIECPLISCSHVCTAHKGSSLKIKLITMLQKSNVQKHNSKLGKHAAPAD